MLNIVTQQNKSHSLREIITRMMQGQSVNVNQHQTFDLDDDPDYDSLVVNEFSDKLEVQDFHIQLSDEINQKVKDYKPLPKDPSPKEPKEEEVINPNPSEDEKKKNETPQN